MSNSSNQEFLIFTLGKEQYALDIHAVQEIRNYETPTSVVNQANFMKGVINLRGNIVPILDLRIKLGLPYDYNEFTVAIILHIKEKFIGVVVDNVCDVTNLEQIQPVKQINNLTKNDYLLGLATVEEHMIQIIDIEKFLA